MLTHEVTLPTAAQLATAGAAVDSSAARTSGRGEGEPSSSRRLRCVVIFENRHRPETTGSHVLAALHAMEGVLAAFVHPENLAATADTWSAKVQAVALQVLQTERGSCPVPGRQARQSTPCLEMANDGTHGSADVPV